MKTVVDMELPAPPERVWQYVAQLDAYTTWMRLVHDVQPAAGASSLTSGEMAWDVELRARVGPFARSKRLRMARTVHDPTERVRFERQELDGRDHADWVLTATLREIPGGTLLTMDLYYGGRLWTAGVLDRVLDNEVRTGKSALLELVTRQTAGPDVS